MRSRRHPPPRTIQAAVFRQPSEPLAIEELKPEGPRDDEVLVRIVASGICHTDIDCRIVLYMPGAASIATMSAGSSGSISPPVSRRSARRVAPESGLARVPWRSVGASRPHRRWSLRPRASHL